MGRIKQAHFFFHYSFFFVAALERGANISFFIFVAASIDLSSFSRWGKQHFDFLYISFNIEKSVVSWKK